MFKSLAMRGVSHPIDTSRRTSSSRVVSLGALGPPTSVGRRFGTALNAEIVGATYVAPPVRSGLAPATSSVKSCKTSWASPSIPPTTIGIMETNFRSPDLQTRCVRVWDGSRPACSALIEGHSDWPSPTSPAAATPDNNSWQGRPKTSSLEYPKMRSAARFQNTIVWSRETA